MKQTLLVILFIWLINGSIIGQLDAIFINDNSISEQNTEEIFQIIEQYLGTLDYFDAVEKERSPSYDELSAYNLVIWYSGKDDDDLYFWESGIKDNPELIEYLDNGGNLWTMGHGFLNSRYIKAPRTFEAGDFIYDYIGFNKWDAESYTDDNGIGVPSLIISPDNKINTLSLNILEWEDEQPEPFIDGCKMVDGCTPAYIFAPGGYELYGEAAAYYFSTGKFKNITFTFDPASIDSKGNTSTLLSDVLRFYEDILSDISENDLNNNSLKIYPNPAIDMLFVECRVETEITIELYDVTGQLVLKSQSEKPNQGKVKSEIDISSLPEGIYLVQIETNETTLSRKVIITK